MTSLVDILDLEVSEPTCFYTWAGNGWYNGRISPLVRKGNTLRFEYFDSDTDDWEETTVMTMEDDCLYHFRGIKEHRCVFLAETKTHVFLTGNFVNEDGRQGVEIWIWPKENVRVIG
jgi:hypothetical protein